MRLPGWLRVFHKWLGLIIGLQLVLWTVSGLIMAIRPIEEVRGDHLVKAPAAAEIKAADERLSISEILDLNGELPVIGVHLTYLLGRPVYELTLRAEKTEQGETARDKPQAVFFDGLTGLRLGPIPAQTAARIAQAHYLGDAPVVATTLITEPTVDTGPKRDLPLWKVDFGDDEKTSVYVSPASGRRAMVRTGWWRTYDFFWMLHIMDYDTRTNFSTPLVQGASALAIIIALSGMIMLFYVFRRRDFRWLGVAKPGNGGKDQMPSGMTREK